MSPQPVDEEELESRDRQRDDRAFAIAARRQRERVARFGVGAWPIGQIGTDPEGRSVWEIAVVQAKRSAIIRGTLDGPFDSSALAVAEAVERIPETKLATIYGQTLFDELCEEDELRGSVKLRPAT